MNIHLYNYISKCLFFCIADAAICWRKFSEGPRKLNQFLHIEYCAISNCYFHTVWENTNDIVFKMCLMVVGVIQSECNYDSQKIWTEWKSLWKWRSHDKSPWKSIIFAHLSLCMLWNFSCLCCHLLTFFFKIKLFQKKSGILSEFDSLIPVLSILVRVQTVCKG